MVANLALALVVVSCLATVVLAILHEVIARVRARARLYAEIDREFSLPSPCEEALAGSTRSFQLRE